ncbi:MAG: hypothetical protein JW800_08140, partial [Candidatus Omnitrophica bacterium]|nr:hypothetical protein [Candidatus Omnitrophota bacterium]
MKTGFTAKVLSSVFLLFLLIFLLYIDDDGILAVMASYTFVLVGGTYVVLFSILSFLWRGLPIPIRNFFYGRNIFVNVIIFSIPLFLILKLTLDYYL